MISAFGAFFFTMSWVTAPLDDEADKKKRK
jgi:hypothetical protein